VRHSPAVRVVHWTIAASILLLFFSGFGQMPLYKRYMLTEVPGLAWTGDYWFTLKLHYAGALVLTAAVAWHMATHFVRREFGLIPRKGDVGESVRILWAMATGRPEPPADKYLAEQRLAYVYIGVNVVLLIVTGLVKTVKNFGVYFDGGLLYWMTLVHNLAAVLLLFGVAMHLLAFVPKSNRKLLPSMFTGKVDLAYASHRHSIWIERLKGKAAAEREKRMRDKATSV
jgi:formate dehydrogenase gamma subunit